MNKKSTSQSAFFNLRVLIASLFCLAGIFTLLLAAGIYSDSAKAQGTTPAQPGSGLPTLVRMVGPSSGPGLAQPSLHSAIFRN